MQTLSTSVNEAQMTLGGDTGTLARIAVCTLGLHSYRRLPCMHYRTGCTLDRRDIGHYLSGGNEILRFSLLS